MDIFSQLLNGLQPELVSIILCAALAGAAYLYQWAVQRLPANAQKIVRNLANTVAQAIEQKYNAASPGGALKKQDAMTMLQSVCEELGLPFNKNSASAEIEAAVWMLNNFGPAAKAVISSASQKQSG